MIGECVEQNEPFGIVLLTSGTEVETGRTVENEMADVGTIARIGHVERLDDGRMMIEAFGENKFQIEDITGVEPYLTAAARPIWDPADDPLVLQPIFDQACGLFREYLVALLAGERRHLSNLQLPSDPSLLASAIGAALQINLRDKQRLLEAKSVLDRLAVEIEILKIEQKTQQYLASDIRHNLDDVEAESMAQDQDRKRTISRVDPSYMQYFISRN